MSYLTGWVLKRKAATVLIMLVVLIFGAISVTQLKNELLPNIEFPIVTVITIYPGASSNDVEEQISKPVDAVVAAIPRLKSLRTVSRESVSFSVAEFEFGTNTKEVQQTIETNLRNVSLPNDLRGVRVQPTIGQFNFNSQPIMYLGVEARQGQTAQQLAEVARNTIKPAIAAINGVANVEIVGDQLRQIKITPRLADLQKRGLSVNDINTTLRGYNLSIPAGTLDVSGQTIPVRTSFAFGSLDQLKNLIVVSSTPAATTGAPAGGLTGGLGAIFGGGTGAGAAAAQAPQLTKLSDIADVVEADAPASSRSRTNGNDGVLLQVFKTQNGNTVDVSDRTIAKVSELSGLSGGAYQVGIIYDTAGQIRASIEGLVKEGLLGAFFAVLVIFLFLRNIRSTLVTAISIPTSMVVAFILLWTQGISLNIMTLGGLAVAVGRVVDDAIVVLENIYRRVQLGEPIESAAKTGTREVASAITSSTLTTVAVFLPLGFVGGVSGQFFLPFALTVTFALLASLVVALTIIPVFAAFFLRRNEKGRGRSENENTLIQRAYTPVLSWSLRNRWKVLGLATLLFLASNLLVTQVPTAFLPQSGDKLLQVSISVAPGSSQDIILETAKRAEEEIGKDSRVELRQTTIAGNSSFGQAQRAFGASSDVSLLVRLNKSADLQQTANDIRARLKPLTPPRGNITVASLGGFSGGSFSLNVQGPDAEAVRKASDLILARVKPVADTGDIVNLRSDLTSFNTQVVVTPNPTASAGRLNTQALGFLLAGSLQPAVATRVRFEGGQLQDVVVYPAFEPGKNADLNGFIENLKKLPILGPITLGAVADVRAVQAPTQSTRIGGKPAASITGDITSDNTGGVSAAALALLKGNETTPGITSDPAWPIGASYAVAGAGQQQSEAFGALFIAFGVAVALVYIVMVLAFGSLLEPFAILFSLPLASIGAFSALFVTQRAIGLPAMIGLLMLIGIVVTNAIVLIDRVNHNVQNGMERNAALIEAGRNRVRPILMTALATVLALMPLALGFSEGSIIAAELGTVVIGGLLTSTFLTLLVVPVVYSLLSGGRDRLLGKKGSGNHPAMPLENRVIQPASPMVVVPQPEVLEKTPVNVLSIEPTNS